MLNDLKEMIGIASDDTGLDAKIKIIIKNATAQLKLRLGGIEPTEELDHVIFGVTLSRFNRIGSEGMEIHTVEGESLHFKDDDFEEYADDIRAFLDKQKKSTRGKVRFI